MKCQEAPVAEAGTHADDADGGRRFNFVRGTERGLETRRGGCHDPRGIHRFRSFVGPA
jgi:hypothetical protein